MPRIHTQLTDLASRFRNLASVVDADDNEELDEHIQEIDRIVGEYEEEQEQEEVDDEDYPVSTSEKIVEDEE